MKSKKNKKQCFLCFYFKKLCGTFKYPMENVTFYFLEERKEKKKEKRRWQVTNLTFIYSSINYLFIYSYFIIFIALLP
jgi:hypothetical protein